MQDAVAEIRHGEHPAIIIGKEEVAELVAALHGQVIAERNPHESRIFLPVWLVDQLTDEIRHHKGFAAARGRLEHQLRRLLRR